MKLFALSLLTMTALIAGSAFAAPRPLTHASAIFIDEMGKKAVEYGSISSTSDKHRKFCQLVKRHTTADYVIKKVMGRYYEQATSHQLAEIKDFIYDLLTAHLTSAFEGLPGGYLEVQPRVFGSGSTVNVNAELKNAGGAVRHKFMFYVSNHSVIIDARIKGVQISDFLENEYTSFMDRSGSHAPVAALIDHLSGKNPACP